MNILLRHKISRFITALRSLLLNMKKSRHIKLRRYIHMNMEIEFMGDIVGLWDIGIKSNFMGFISLGFEKIVKLSNASLKAWNDNGESDQEVESNLCCTSNHYSFHDLCFVFIFLAPSLLFFLLLFCLFIYFFVWQGKPRSWD